MDLIKTAVHYFYPARSNNQKAKLLHISTLFVFILILIAYQVVLQFIPTVGLRILGYAANIPPSQVILLTNQKRTENGLNPLRENSLLSEAAKKKGEDMLANDYWAHVAPDGTQPWKFFTEVGYNYRYAGENLARDFSNSNSAIDAWMASPTHKDNLLSPKYDEIGVAVVEGDLGGVDTTIVVQLFGKSYGSIIPETQPESEQLEVAGIPEEESFEVVQVTNDEVSIEPVEEIAQQPPQEFPENNYVIQSPVAGVESNTAVGSFSKISPFATTKNISLITIGVLLAVLLVDAIVTNRKNIARIGGRTFAHLAFLGMIISMILIARAGSIL